MINQKLDEQIEADEDVSKLNHQSGRIEGIEEILDLLGKKFAAPDGGISIPMLNWQRIRRQYRRR